MTGNFNESDVVRKKGGPGGGQFDHKRLNEAQVGGPGGIDLVMPTEPTDDDNSDWHLHTSAPQCGAKHAPGTEAHMWGDERNWCPGNPASDAEPVDADLDRPDSDFAGSGWGTHRPVAPIHVIGDVAPGDVLAEHSDQFGARNLIRVTRVDPKRGILHGHFAAPHDPTRARMADDQEIAVWDFAMQPGRSARYYSTDTKVPTGLTPSHPYPVRPGEDAAELLRNAAARDGFCDAPKAACDFASDAQAAGFNLILTHNENGIHVYAVSGEGPEEKSMNAVWSKTTVYDQPVSAGQLPFRTSSHGSREAVRFDYAEGRGLDNTGRLAYVAPKSLRQARLMVGIPTK